MPEPVKAIWNHFGICYNGRTGRAETFTEPFGVLHWELLASFGFFFYETAGETERNQNKTNFPDKSGPEASTGLGRVAQQSIICIPWNRYVRPVSLRC